MKDIYVIESIDNLDDSFLEYVYYDDKLFFVLGCVLKNKKDFLKRLETFEQIKIINDIGKVFDGLDFRLIPFLTEMCCVYKNHNIILVSSNPKLSCLKEYFKRYLGFEIKIVPSIQFYRVAKYIESFSFIKDFDIACEILFNIIKYNQLNIDYISDKKIRKSLSRRHTLMKSLSELAYDFELKDSQLFIETDTTVNCYSKIKALDLDLPEDSLKRIAYFLHKSDSFGKFKERITSSNNLNLSKEKKEEILKKVEMKIINNEL